ncbi:unnamed protein product [Dicrocoelium dendriticum]|nr:unnamed protein product [Dicrocoelium dendriticum]
MPGRKRKRGHEVTSPMGSRHLSNPSVHSDTVDKKTKQLLFFETKVCILGRSTLRNDESYTQVKAEVLMNRFYDKRQSHCILYCLEDCLRFEKTKCMGMQPLRNFVKYKHIRHVFIFEDKPNVFMLCIDSGRSNRRTYEAFKCKRKEDVLALCEIIYKASQDPNSVLHDLVPIREVSRYSDLSIPIQYHSTSELERRAYSTGILSPGPSTSRDGELLDANIEERKYAHPLRMESMHSAPTINREHLVRCQVTYDNTISPNWRNSAANEIRQRLMRKSEDKDWEVTMMFLRWDNLHGAIVNEYGPIYFYVARRLTPS